MTKYINMSSYSILTGNASRKPGIREQKDKKKPLGKRR
jgi:hypothetical protein